MIQAIMLIALGFSLAGLLGVMVAPSLWNRAYRLSKRHIEKNLPISLEEIEAAQDHLRAEYAVRIRRLENSLASARQKAAAQLVENGLLQMQIASLKEEMVTLQSALAERSNAANVLQVALSRRVPDLERDVTVLKRQLAEKASEIETLTHKLKRKDEVVEAETKAARAALEELERLREAMEKNAADRGDRLVRRASGWSLADYKSEYDRLNLELSKLRQENSRLKDRESQQASLIKNDLQRLAELVLSQTKDTVKPKLLEASEPLGAEPLRHPRSGRARPLPVAHQAVVATSVLTQAAIAPGATNQPAGGHNEAEAPKLAQNPGGHLTPPHNQLHNQIKSSLLQEIVDEGKTDDSSSSSKLAGIEIVPTGAAQEPGSTSPDDAHAASLMERLKALAQEKAKA